MAGRDFTGRVKGKYRIMSERKSKMKAKSKIKRAVDLLMTLVLLFLMGYQLWGETAHEWAGAGMLVLFLVHHLLNHGWYRNLFRRKYTVMRVLISAVDLALLAVMICLMASGIVMSRPGLTDSGCADCGIWSVCFCDKRSGDLHVSEDTVCFPGLQ